MADDARRGAPLAVEARRRGVSRCRSACSATRPRSCPSCWPRARRSTSSPTRPRRTTRSSLPAARRGVRGHGSAARGQDPAEFTARARESMAEHVEAMVGFQDARRRGVRLRQLDPRRGAAGRLRAAPSTSRASCRRTSGRCSARARARSAGPRCPATRPTSPPPTGAVLDLFPRQRVAGPLDPDGRRAGALPGAAGADLLARATASGTWPGCAFNELVGRGERPGADRDRPRPPRLRLGRLAVPGDRGDGRRLGRDRRLAAAERAWSTSPPGRPGCRSTTAAASASAGRSTPARSAWPTARALAAQKLERVLTNDPGMGVIRHVDAGYDARPPRSRRPMRRRAASRCSERLTAAGLVAGPPRRAARAGCWASLLPRSGGTRSAGGYRRFAWTRGRPGLPRLVRRRRPPSRGLARAETDRNGNLWAWWERGRARAGARGHRQPPGLGARTAAPSTGRSAWSRRSPPSTCCASRGFAPARPIGGRRASPTRRAPGSAWPAWAPGCSPAPLDPAAARGADATTTGSRWPRRWRAAGRDPDALGRDDELLGRIGAFVELHVEQGRGPGRPGRAGRGGQRDLAARPVAASTSPARPTTRAPRGSTTGATRCCPTRHDGAGRPRRSRERTARWPPFGQVRSSPTAPTRSRRGSAPGWTPARRTSRRSGPRWSPSSPQAASDRPARRPSRSTVTGVADARSSSSTAALRDRLAARAAGTCPGAADRSRARRRHPGRPRCPPRCCSCATRPASRTPRPSTPSHADCAAGRARARRRAARTWPADDRRRSWRRDAARWLADCAVVDGGVLPRC